MVIGSGLLARAFQSLVTATDVCIFASGVANSGCSDPAEFAREEALLRAALQEHAAVAVFVYFSTCSMRDPDTRDSAYVRHKGAMERLVTAHPGHLLLRLPQLASHSANEHTLLNFLHNRIMHGRTFEVWNGASRNVIDVDDVVAVASQLIDDPAWRATTVNIANTTSHDIMEIVRTMERVVGRTAICTAVGRGARYEIDVDAVRPVLVQLGLRFDCGYLQRTLDKYYGYGSRP